MKTHELKCWPAEFEAIRKEDKAHEVRKDDRGFEVGDKLRLREWSPVTEAYTGRWMVLNVTYKTEGGTWGLPPDLCVMSLIWVDGGEP